MINRLLPRIGRLGAATLFAGAVLGAGTLGVYAAPPGPPTVTGVSPSSGSTAGGFTVDITGTEFKSVQSVAFGDLPATVLSTSPTLITATVPNASAECTTGSCADNVTVTTKQGGTSATNPSDVFTYVAPSSPPPPPPTCNTPTGRVVSGTGTMPAYSQPAGSTWVLRPGAANDIATGGGQTYVVGSNAVAGGFGVYHWTGSGWAPLPGGLVNIAVDSSGTPWGINSFQQIYHWTRTGWALVPGSAYELAAGPNGAVYALGTTATGGGCQIFSWNGGGWTWHPGGAIRIAVGTSDNPWVVNNNNSIYAWTGGAWELMSGSANNIAATAASVWVLGTDPVAGGWGIHYFTGSGWGTVAGDGVTIAVGSNKLPWVTNENLNIYQRV